ncbi:cyclic peptide export ABC transporter [Microbulbifer sp. GL-2]|uniref:cyclic peptide export ABC transporter n=1 Tax=Microbulbifer sp. GL-2 TaxID=2591606 RepID=UPI001162B724|nr:cyclic peptide export ABC transporter [Microbulbifer sp. GL-2]BBM00782.1 ABC transporter ATP-binding protein [Microbulbifer sp. GL-2]
MELRRLTDLYWNLSPNLFFISILLGIVTGACYSLLVPFIMYAVSSDMSYWGQLEIENYSFFQSPTSQLAIFFAAACGLLIVFRTSSLVLSTYVAKKASMQHRLHLYQRINALPYADLERIGQPRLINIINIDIPAINVAATNLPMIWGHIVTILGILAYIVYLDSRVFTFCVLSLLIGIITYQIPIALAARLFARSREYHDAVQTGVKGLIAGAKELKLNKLKAKDFFQHDLDRPERLAFREVIRGYVLHAFAVNYGGIISFIVIGVAVFHLPYIYQIDQFELFGIVMALLYLTGPVGSILISMDSIQQGQVSLKKVKAFYLELSEESIGTNKNITPNWTVLNVRDLTYIYGVDFDGFGLKPINVTFRRGEINFIVGGNGSGKSTLSKCLSLHYLPTSGQIEFDDELVNSDSLQSARENISVIYSDYHLFKRLHAKKLDPDWVQSYLEYLELDGKVKFNGNEVDSLLLSDGQKRRMALLALLLEDRPICIFDEWAADQDPRFKNIFYSKILPDLKARNKLVIVISHDERYFSHADRIIHMANGGIERIEENCSSAKNLDLVN